MTTVIPVVSFVAVGCGGSAPPAPSSGSVVTVAAVPSTVTAAPSTVTVTAEAGTLVSSTAQPAPTVQPRSTALPAPTEAAAVMPDVVCQNLQDAQDEIQRAGVFFSRSDDATGRGRAQVVDRNWIVVAQTPAAGSPVGEAEAILSVVKIGEENAC